MQTTDVDEFLSHFGVKGMKWGVRRNRDAGDTRAARRALIKNRKNLTDEELVYVINRLQTERKVKSLLKEDLYPGSEITTRLLSDSGQKVARTVLYGAGLLAVRHLMQKKFGDNPSTNSMLNYIAPKPKIK